jgi:protein ImuA
LRFVPAIRTQQEQMSRPIPLSAARALLPLAGPGHATPDDAARVGFGDDVIDARLGGGLLVAALHEFYAAREGDGVAASGLALLLALRCGRPGPLVWLREDRAWRGGRPYGLGLAALGADPGRLLIIQAPDTLAMLRAGAEAVGCTSVAAVIIEHGGRASGIDLTATRRLGLAAARTGVMTMLVRAGEPVPSAAQSRWQVAAASSMRLAANAPGLSALDIRLLRHRGGVADLSTRLEWDSDSQRFAPARSASLSGGVPAFNADRTNQAAARAA